jgi:glycosyltransferase involved in cell wall biosynthesis
MIGLQIAMKSPWSCGARDEDCHLGEARLAILASHPIQYYVPLYRALAATGLDLEVWYHGTRGIKPSWDEGFQRNVQFDVPLLGGYRHRFLVQDTTVGSNLRLGAAAYKEARRLMWEQRRNALVAFGYGRITNMLAIALPRPLGAKALLFGDSNPLPRPGIVRGAVKTGVLSSLFSRVDHFLVCGQRNEEYYRQYGVPPTRMTKACFSVDNHFFRERANAAGPNRHEIRRRLGLPDTGPVFLFCGKFVPHKRPLDALRGFAIARRRSSCTLAIVGSGECEAAMKTEADRLGLGDSVAFLGFRNQSELPAVFASADALIVPSAFEPWGLVVNEAMACGLAIAASDVVGAVPDLVKDNGFVFPVGDLDALANGLSNWVERPIELASARAASLRIIDRWGIRQTVDGFVDGIQRALAAR